ncbi:dihydropteroate synthase [Volucribacter amazonae]|uniref:Dihydropteroate synthase n=1 Tax=Volucribacter amazonae TaxID=256731 RepID=A0A9X4SL35_9PAST|nr:dihydropteroate synthase [Volucribacter amazonae]MDG6894658.1 dihydropteroate synthase [Volucribacter amazonae]
MILQAREKTLDLATPKIMGILNFTPDSFSDSGQFFQLDKALYHAEKMLNAGASIIDIGGESTRPMAEEVSLEQELERVIPLVEAIHQRFDCWISVDSSKAEVIRQASEVGMDMINDIRALSEPNALHTAAQLNLPVCIMHMQGQPRTMQTAPQYNDVVKEVRSFLQQKIEQCCQAGIAPQHILIDPGFGFGKSVQHNYQLLAHLTEFSALGFPVLAGLSRKSMLGAILDKPVEQRIIASVAGALIAAQNGAKILRVHDVAETADALKIWQATQDYQ